MKEFALMVMLNGMPFIVEYGDTEESLLPAIKSVEKNDWFIIKIVKKHGSKSM